MRKRKSPRTTVWESMSQVPIRQSDCGRQPSGTSTNVIMAQRHETFHGIREGSQNMGSKGKRRASRENHDFAAARRNVPEPPGGLPSAGSGYEPDPFSPVGSWIQSSRFIEGVGRRLGRRVMLSILIIMAALYLLVIFH